MTGSEYQPRGQSATAECHCKAGVRREAKDRLQGCTTRASVWEGEAMGRGTD